MQTTTVQAGIQSLPDHHASFPFSSTITRGLSYAMLTLAMTNFVAHSRPAYSNNALMSCPPNEQGLIPLGQENFTACLQHNPSGKYVLVSPINFSNFSDEEKMHYPMYNIASPFKGALDTGDHYIADLYLNRTGISALFGAIANSNFRVHFKNPYVIGTTHAAVLAAMARGHNTINMTVDHATAMTICPSKNCDSSLPPLGFAAIVLGTAKDSNLSIYFRAQSTHTQTKARHAPAGIVAAQIKNSSIDMDVNTNFSQLTTLGKHTCAGAVGYHVFGPCRSCFFKAQTNFNKISIVSKGIFSAVGATIGCTNMYNTDSNDIKLVNKINSKINTITIHASGTGSFIGTCIGMAYGHHNIINLSVNDAYIIGDNAYVGGVVGHIMENYYALPNASPHTITANVGKVLIRNTGNYGTTGIMIGFVSMKNEELNLWLQGGHINISAHTSPSALAIGTLEGIRKESYAVIGNVVATVNGHPSAIGVGDINTFFPNNKNLAILFVAGQAELSNPAFILQPGTCPYSLIDQSGINVNTDTLGCQNALVVQSIEPQGWRSAMKRLQPILCPSQPQHLSCHYLNEQPAALAAIPSSSGRFYLVSQQRYPYNRTAEHDALIRVTGLKLLFNQFNPSVDPLFGSDGTALYSPNNDTLPLSPPHSVNVDGDNLYHLYKENNQSVLAHFKLNHTNAVYHRNPLVTEGDVVQLDQGGVWLQRNHSLEHYIIDPTTLSLKNKNKVIQLTTSTNVSAPVIGAQFFYQGIYVARLIDNNTTHPEAKTAILYEQYPVHNPTSAMWNETVYGNFSNANQYTMQVIMNRHGEAFIALLPSTDLLINNNCSEVVAYTAHLMPQGGPAKWSYSTPSIFTVHFFESSSESRSGPESCLDPASEPKKLNLAAVLAASASAVLVCASLITIGTCILCRKKSCSCPHKYQSLHINEEKNSRNNSAIHELSSPFSSNERDPLLSNQQRESARQHHFGNN